MVYIFDNSFKLFLLMDLDSLNLGPLRLASPLTLAPLAGYTNLPFRLVIREIGGVGLCTTDLVNARSLLEKNKKALKLIETAPADSPFAVQLFGSVPEEMAAAAQELEARGVHSIDINMGCPVRKVCKVGGGSAMMTECDKTAALVGKMIAAVKIPITCKMRLGWDAENLTAPDLARALEAVGVSAITIHGRTREQGFAGSVNLAGIRAVAAAVKIPVIGNGDVTTPQAAKRMLSETNCSGIAIGRGAFYNPWLFQHILHYLRTDELPEEPTFDERVAVMTRHFNRMVEVFGEGIGCRMFRKVGPWYAKRFGPCSLFNKKVVLLSTADEYLKILEDYREWRSRFLDADGNLQPKYVPADLTMNFSDGTEPAVARRTAIPVPSGPQELW